MADVIRAHGHETNAHIVRNHSRLDVRLHRSLADKDRTRRLVRRAGGQMLEGKQQKLLADPGIGKTDAARISRIRRCDYTARVVLDELRRKERTTARTARTE